LIFRIFIAVSMYILGVLSGELKAKGHGHGHGHGLVYAIGKENFKTDILGE
jgi:hypothetical protein